MKLTTFDEQNNSFSFSTSQVRPEEVLEKALDMVQKSEKNYLYKCDQLKSIRQDLTVQHIRNQLTVKVYDALW